MEEWQRKHITENLPELIRCSRFNVLVKTELTARNILGQEDVENLDALQNQHGQSVISYHYYQLLMGRTNAYKVLTKALIENHQNGAARILIDGVPKNVSDKPLTYLGIYINWDGFKDMEIEVNGKKLSVHEFLPNVNYGKLQKIFQDTVSELEIYDTFVTKERTFVLSKNTIPPKPPIYLPRFVSNRIKINVSIFKADCPDVFVFKNSIERDELSEIVRPDFTTDSTYQLDIITCRFIYLYENEDWTELKKTAKEPIHLINYEADGNHFILEDTTAASDILRRIGSRNERVYTSEEDFVQQQLSKDCTSASLCICDTPGMGKTFFLASIARLLANNCAGRMIVFIPLTTFCNQVFLASLNSTSVLNTFFFNVIEYVLPPRQNPDLLLKLIEAELLQLEVFFDGFDEIPADEREWTKQVFRQITTNFSKVRIYITSRPHMRHELENSLGVVAYDMLPFNRQNQFDFLIQFWQNTQLSSYQSSLPTYATKCLEAANKSLTKNDREIAGIPLLCQLIAEIYADKVTLLKVIRTGFSNTPLKICGMYQNFIEKRISHVSKDKTEFNDIKLVLVWHALKLLFPVNNFHENSDFNHITHLLDSPEILKTVILQQHSNAALEFIHRTFAEYLTADYFCTKLKDKKMQNSEEMNCSSTSILVLLLKCKYNGWSYDFMHPAIASFFNSVLGVSISEDIKIQAATFITSISHEELIWILCACCQHNLFNILSFLKESLTKLDNSRILDFFSNENSHGLLKVCIKESTSEVFHSCIQLLAEVPQLDLAQINTFEKDFTLLQLAVKYVNYEAVEYFVNRISLQNQNILKECVVYRGAIEKSKRILNLLLNKDPTLILETPPVLLTFGMDVRLFKILCLRKSGVNLTCVGEYGDNCAMYAAEYMSPSDFLELVKFLLSDYCKAEYLFLDNEKWKYPLPKIIEKATLLPETLELLLNIPDIDIHMKDEYGENLLFSAVCRNKVEVFQQLEGRGLDYRARGFENRSLLHVAAGRREVNLVNYLSSLKSDTSTLGKHEESRLDIAISALNLRFSQIDVLEKNGANVQDETAFCVNASEYNPNVDMVKYLIGKGIGVNDFDNYGNTPLHLCQNKEVRDSLIEKGADIYAINKMGQTPAQMNPDLWK